MFVEGGCVRLAVCHSLGQTVQQQTTKDVAAALRGRTEQTGGRGFALVDGALSPDALTKFGRPAPCQSVVPPDGAVSLADLSALPFLLDLSALNAERHNRCMANLVELAIERSAVSWLTSPLALPELATQLGQRMDVELSGNLSMILRFADARVLPVLHDTLHMAQRASFFGCCDGWWYLDRQENLRELPLGESTPARYHPPLRLDPIQEQHMIDAAEPDAVLQLLAQHDAESLNRIARAARYDFARQSIDQAKRWSLETPSDLMLYCMVALEQGPDLPNKPLGRPRWATCAMASWRGKKWFKRC